MKGVKKHMKDSRNPSLTKVLDKDVPMTFATMVDPPASEAAPRLTAAQCRARYQLAPTAAAAIASARYQFITHEDEYIGQLA